MSWFLPFTRGCSRSFAILVGLVVV